MLYAIAKNSYIFNHLNDCWKARLCHQILVIWTKKNLFKFTMHYTLICRSGSKVKLYLFKITCWNLISLLFSHEWNLKISIMYFLNIIFHRYWMCYFIAMLWLPMNCLRNDLQILRWQVLCKHQTIWFIR